MGYDLLEFRGVYNDRRLFAKCVESFFRLSFFVRVAKDSSNGVFVLGVIVEDFFRFFILSVFIVIHKVSEFGFESGQNSAFQTVGGVPDLGFA